MIKNKVSLFIIIIMSLSLILVIQPINYTVKATNTVIASNSESTENGFYSMEAIIWGSYSAVGNTFLTPSTPYLLTSCSFYLRLNNGGTPNATMQAFLYDTSGNPAIPTGSILISSSNTILTTVLNSTFELYNFNFNNYLLAVNHVYAIVLELVSSTKLDSSNYVLCGYSSTNTYNNGMSVRYYQGWGAISSYDTCFYVYGILNGGVTFSNVNTSTKENGLQTSLSWTSTKISNNLTPNGGYIFSWDYSGSYVNSTWIAFSNSNSESDIVNKYLDGTLGQTVHWLVYANDSNNIWTATDIQTFVIQATITFTFTEGGQFWVNSVSVSNNTQITYTSPTTLNLLALESSGYGFFNFTQSNTPQTFINNNYVYTVTNNTNMWAFMNLKSVNNNFNFFGNATSDKVFSGYTFYGSNSTLQTGTYVLPTPMPTLVPTPTLEETQTPEFSDGLMVGIIIAIAISLLISFALWSSRKKW